MSRVCGQGDGNRDRLIVKGQAFLSRSALIGECVKAISGRGSILAELIGYKSDKLGNRRFGLHAGR